MEAPTSPHEGEALTAAVEVELERSRAAPAAVAAGGSGRGSEAGAGVTVTAGYRAAAAAEAGQDPNALATVIAAALPHPHLAPGRRLTAVASILSGAIAACTAVTVSNVPETIKTRIQLDGEGVRGGGGRQYTGIWHAARTIAAKEGWRGLQAGLGTALAYQAVMNGIRLGLYEPLQHAARGALGVGSDSMSLKVVAAAASGALGAGLASPLYLVKNRLQAESAHFKVREAHGYAGMVDGLTRVYRAEGVRGLFRGVDGAILRVMVGSAAQLTSYDVFRRWLAAAGLPDGVTLSAASSLLSAITTVTAMNPFDVVSTRLYQSAGRATVYTGPLDCAIQTARTEGAAAFMKGWTPQLVRLGPHIVITFMVLDVVRPLMQRVDAFVVSPLQ